MIYIAERHVEDYLHVLANVNTIKIFKEVFPSEKICFISAYNHNVKVSDYFEKNDNNILFKSFKNRKPQKKTFSNAISLIKKAIDDIVFFKFFFDNKQLDDVLIISHIYPHSLLFFNLLKRFYPKCIVLVMLHGEVEYILFFKNFYQKTIGLLYKFCLKIKPSNLNYIFLTKASEKILSEYGFLHQADVISMELPTIVETTNISKLRAAKDEPLKIGHIGSAGTRKNVNKFYEIAEKIHPLIDSGLVRMCIVGVLEESINPYLNTYVKNFVNNKTNVPIDRKTYDLELSNLDYAMFFYGENDFLLRSSAAFFDAIAYEKPMIVLRSKFFTNLFEEYGNMGYLCNNLEQMQQVIEYLISKPHESMDQSNGFIKNIRAYKGSLSIANIAQDIKNRIEVIMPDHFIKKTVN